MLQHVTPIKQVVNIMVQLVWINQQEIVLHIVLKELQMQPKLLFVIIWSIVVELGAPISEQILA